MNLRARARAFRAGLPALPLRGAFDARWSVISSVHDASGGTDDALLEIALNAADRARTLRLRDLEARCSEQDALWVRTWPGEHYRLLAALVLTTHPDCVIEVGTFKGLGALALSVGSSPPHVVTYDIHPWHEFPGTALLERDFRSGQLEQRIGDLGQASYRDSQLDTLRSAQIIFIDGPKDGEWEEYAVPGILSTLTERRRLIVVDDIRLVEMVQLWRDLCFPKLDITSLGHWSGTGLLFTA